MWGPFRDNGAPMGTISPLKLPGHQIKSQLSKEQTGILDPELLGPLEQAGLLNKEPMGPLWMPWVMGPLEQAGVPD